MKPPCDNPLPPLSPYLYLSPSPSPSLSFSLMRHHSFNPLVHVCAGPIPPPSTSAPPSLLTLSLRRHPRMPLRAFTFVPRLINHGLPLFLEAVPRGTHGPIGFIRCPDARWKSHSPEPHTIPRDLDITDDRIVNGVTQDPELSSETSTCVVYRVTGG